MKKASHIVLLLLATLGMSCRLVAGREIRIHLFLLSNQKLSGKPDSIARFPQGTIRFAEYVLKELRIPQIDQETMTGFEWCKFILSYDSLGKLKDAARDPSHEYYNLESVFLSFFRGMPDWQPATKGGQSVACRILLELIIFENPTLLLDKNAVSVFESTDESTKQLCDKFYNQGVACFGRANYSEALIFFNQAVQVKPDDVDSWFNKGIAHYKLNELEKACKSWQVIIKMGKKDPEVEDLIRKNCKGREEGVTKGNEEVIKKDESEIFTIVETTAEFPGGISELMSFIQKNVNYPDKFKELHLGGRIFLKFIINENGDISNVLILKGSGVKEFDNEALRVISSMPTWEPAQMGGKKVKTYFNLPFSFAIGEPYYFFNTENKNEDYNLAWQALLSDNPNKALELYSRDTDDVEAWYNMAVIHFYKKNKKEAKKYFEKVKGNIKDQKNQYYVLADRFLKNEF